MTDAPTRSPGQQRMDELTERRRIAMLGRPSEIEWTEHNKPREKFPKGMYRRAIDAWVRSKQRKPK